MAQLTIQQAFDLALQHQHSGRLSEAEGLYRQILASQPQHANSIYNLGMIALRLGRGDVGVDLIRQSLAIEPNNAVALCNLGIALQQILDTAIQYHQSGRLREAEQLYQKILACEPTHAGAMRDLGIIAGQTGRNDAAIDLLRRAIDLNPNFPQAHNNLGNALRQTRQLDEAVAAYRSAIALQPDVAEAHYNLGITLQDTGDIDQAIVAHRRAIALNANWPEAHNHLANALRHGGRLSEAVVAYRTAIALRPNFTEAHHNLGMALKDTGHLDQAIAAFRQVVAQRPDHAEAYNNLGIVLQSDGQLDEALSAYRRAVALRPRYAEGYNNIGMVLQYKGELDLATAMFQQAITLKTNLHEAHNNLGNTLKEQGLIDEAISAFRQAIALDPTDMAGHNNLIFALHLHPAYDAAAIAEEQRRWNRQHAEPLRNLAAADFNGPSPDRRLRIGYLSPDFREHVVGRSLLPFFSHHDHRQFNITCYAQVLRPDGITSRFRQAADNWRHIVGLSDEQVAARIKEDRIDILVDLSLHSAGNRLLVFARKPAPVQVTYLGYCGSTGMSTMDYRFSDPYLDPLGAAEGRRSDTELSCYTEKTLRLPHTYWCYLPRGPAADPSPAPALKNGFVTFGCLNNFAKVSTAALDLWGRILVAVPHSRMILHAPPGTHLKNVAERLQHAGVEKERVTFIGRQPWGEYTQTYSKIDIALDPFPYGGGITTCDALWMGVPVITLSGRTAVGRGGRSILSNLGLADLIAFTTEQYVEIAVALAEAPDRMDGLRQAMRGRMLASPLMDAAGFARDVETAYRQMWHQWCETAASNS